MNCQVSTTTAIDTQGYCFRNLGGKVHLQQETVTEKILNFLIVANNEIHLFYATDSELNHSLSYALVNIYIYFLFGRKV